MRTSLLSLFVLYSSWILAQNPELEYRSVDYYFDQMATMEFDALLEQGILLDSLTIAEPYLDKENNTLNQEGFMKYFKIRMMVNQKFFQDFLYQQHIRANEHVYVLYFNLSGTDDTEWHVFKWPEAKWSNDDKLSKLQIEADSTIQHLFWNYDEGPKNLEGIKIFTKDDYLIFERGGLYHSLYNMRTDEVLFNEVSPWTHTMPNSIEELNKWIKENLHDKIAAELEK